MVFATLLPLGVMQLWHSVNDGYFEARTLGYLTEPGNVLIEWLRMPGDVLFLVGGILPFVWIAWLGVRRAIPATVTAMEPETLFVVESDAAREDRTGVPAARAPRFASDRTGAPADTPLPRRSPYASDRRASEDGRRES